MKLKKAAALLCATVMMVGMLAGCGGGSDNGAGATDSGNQVSGTEGGNGEIEEIVFATPVVKTVDMQPIEDAINAITEEKIGVRVHIEAISGGNYTNQIGLMQSGGEQLDLMGFMGTYSLWLANNQMMSMNDYIDTYASGLREAVGEEFLKSTTSAGSIYAVPTLNGKAAVVNIILRKDLIDELSLPVDQLKQAATMEEYCANLDLLTDMFAQIREAHPEYALVPDSGNSLLFTRVPFVDVLGDNYGVLMPGEENTVTNLYESEEFARLLDYAYKWNQAGYILEDATTTQESGATYLQNGRAFGYFTTGEEGAAEQATQSTGVEVEAFKLLEPFIGTADVNGLGFALSATSKHPEAAMKFLNEMYTNPDIVNLLDWGVENVHYVKNGDGTIDFPEGVDANTTSYGLNMGWFFGNQFLSYTWGEGSDTTVMGRLEENNKNARYTPVMGFSYDSTKVSTELAAINNVKEQYLPGLECGAVDPQTELPKFVKALKAAGLDKVIEEKQTQLNEWKEANK